MSVDVAPEIVVSRPRAAVAAYMFDPHKDREWTGGVVECRPLTDGLLRKGSRVERVSQFLGRKFGYLVEVTAAEDDRFVHMHVDKPFPMEIRYELEDEGAGTRVRIRAKGEATGFFKLAGPFLSRMVNKSISEDLGRLKARIESR
jgi:hypothetical protein